MVRRWWLPVRDLAAWPVSSQVGSRRNALVASTHLAQRRREHEETERFLANHGRPPFPHPRANTGGDSAFM